MLAARALRLSSKTIHDRGPSSKARTTTAGSDSVPALMFNDADEAKDAIDRRDGDLRPLGVRGDLGARP